MLARQALSPLLAVKEAQRGRSGETWSRSCEVSKTESARLSETGREGATSWLIEAVSPVF